MDKELTPRIKEWLEAAVDTRDLAAGAEMVFRITKNRILYDNIMRKLPKSGPLIEYHLQKAYNVRVRTITRAEVAGMMSQAAKIDKSHNLSGKHVKSNFQRGMRADHDELPQEVRSLWDENKAILLRMRKYHLQLSMINDGNSTCPDNDRYPLAKELVALDRKYRDNFNLYDHYVKGTPLATTEKVEDERRTSANAMKLCHLLLGRYAKKPDDDLKTRIFEAYGKVISPTSGLQKKMRDAGLIK